MENPTGVMLITLNNGCQVEPSIQRGGDHTSQRIEQGLMRQHLLSIKQQAEMEEIFQIHLSLRDSIPHLFHLELDYLPGIRYLRSSPTPRQFEFTYPSLTLCLCPPLSPIWNREQNAFPSLQPLENEKKSDFHPISFSSFILIISTQSTEIIIFTMMNVQLAFPI